MSPRTDSIDTSAIIDGTSNTLLGLVSNIMKIRHDTAKNTISNVR